MYYMASRLGEWLIVELKKRGWSQRELARRAGLTSGTVSNMINGIFEPDTTTLAAIANGLKVPKETVFREAGVLANSQEGSCIAYG